MNSRICFFPQGEKCFNHQIILLLHKIKLLQKIKLLYWKISIHRVIHIMFYKNNNKLHYRLKKRSKMKYIMLPFSANI